MKSILFVCTGNTCRSPMAEGIFLDAVAGRDDYEVRSAGVAASKGAPMSRETAAVLKRRGVGLEGFASQPVSAELLKRATHVFAMTRGHLQVLESRFPEFTDKFYLVGEFAEGGQDGRRMDVPDPIGLGNAAYEEVAAVLEKAIPSMIAYVDQTWKVED